MASDKTHSYYKICFILCIHNNLLSIWTTRSSFASLRFVLDDLVLFAGFIFYSVPDYEIVTSCDVSRCYFSLNSKYGIIRRMPMTSFYIKFYAFKHSYASPFHRG